MSVNIEIHLFLSVIVVPIVVIFFYFFFTAGGICLKTFVMFLGLLKNQWAEIIHIWCEESSGYFK